MSRSDPRRLLERARRHPLLAVAGLLAAALLYAAGPALERGPDAGLARPAPQPAAAAPATAHDGARTVREAFRNRRSGFMVTLQGHVARTLPDDREGSRHQRFIVVLDGDHSVLVAHNIDLAPRVPLDRGDRVEVHGQYEWNERGGVLHWTHHDPQRRHEEGWVRHEGQLYR